MDERVRTYLIKALTELGYYSETMELWLVWKCKTIQNYKYVFSTDRGLFIEVTYNGDKDEVYIDVYTKLKKIIYNDFKKGTFERTQGW